MIRAVVREKGSSRESHADQELSRVEEAMQPFFVPEPIGIYNLIQPQRPPDQSSNLQKNQQQFATGIVAFRPD